jgi:hypothetical protein
MLFWPDLSEATFHLQHACLQVFRSHYGTNFISRYMEIARYLESRCILKITQHEQFQILRAKADVSGKRNSPPTILLRLAQSFEKQCTKRMDGEY